MISHAVLLGTLRTLFSQRDFFTCKGFCDGKEYFKWVFMLEHRGFKLWLRVPYSWPLSVSNQNLCFVVIGYTNSYYFMFDPRPKWKPKTFDKKPFSQLWQWRWRDCYQFKECNQMAGSSKAGMEKSFLCYFDLNSYFAFSISDKPMKDKADYWKLTPFS